MSTSFIVGSSFAISFIIDWSVSCFFRSSSSSAVISSLENAAESSVAMSLHLFHSELFAQARLNVVCMSRSHRERGMPFSFASAAAPRISSPGFVPVCSPMRRWKDESAVFASRKNPLPSFMTFLMSMFSQLDFSVFDFILPSSSSMQILSGFSLSIREETSSTLVWLTWAVPTRIIS